MANTAIMCSARFAGTSNPAGARDVDSTVLMTEETDRETAVDELFDRRDEPGVRDQLVERFMPLAESLARRYQHAGQPIEDLTQVAGIGLINAVDRFDGE